MTSRITSSIRRPLAYLAFAAVVGSAVALPSSSRWVASFLDDEGDEVEIALEEAPGAVQEVVKTLEAKKITTVVREQDGGATVFEIDYLTAEGIEASVKMAASGDIIEREASVSVDELPAALRERLSLQMPGATIKGAERVEAHSFEVKVVIDGKTHEIVINAAGGIDEDDKGDVGDDDDDDDDDDRDDD